MTTISVAYFYNSDMQKPRVRPQKDVLNVKNVNANGRKVGAGSLSYVWCFLH